MPGIVCERACQLRDWGKSALMDDSAVMTAMVRGDPAGPAAVYDDHAAALYDYCLWLGADPALAARVLRDTFAAYAALPPGQIGAHKLRPYLYTAARDACRRPEPAAGAAPDGAPGDAAPGDAAGATDLAEARRLARACLADLDPLEQEVVELRFRHGLTAAETGTVLGIPANQVPDLAESARRYLQDLIGALVMVRDGPPSCPQLARLLAGRDEPLTVATGKLAARHIRHCRQCSGQRPGYLRPERLPDLLPLATLPDGLGEKPGPEAAAAGGQAWLDAPDDTPHPRGFRRIAALATWGGIKADPGAATALGAVVVWVAAAVTATVLTLSGSHSAHAQTTQASARAHGSASAQVSGAASPHQAPGSTLTVSPPASPSPSPSHS